MIIDLKSIIHVPNAEIPFDYTADFTDVELNQQKPFNENVHIKGFIKNQNDVLILSGILTTRLHWICDRCAEEFESDAEYTVDSVLAESVENEEDEDEIILIHDSQIDLDEIFASQAILETPFKILCKKDCKGLCPKCGKNLNKGECSCSNTEIDPRMAPLLKLLKKD